MIVGITKPIDHKFNVAFLMKTDGSKHSCFPVKNSLDGSRQLVKHILHALSSESLTDVIIGLEATSIYGDNLVCFLREDWKQYQSGDFKAQNSRMIPAGSRYLKYYLGEAAWSFTVKNLIFLFNSLLTYHRWTLKPTH